MDREVVIEIIRALPSLLALLLVLLLVLFNRRRIGELIDRIGSFKAFGVEAQFGQAKQQLRQALISYNINADDKRLKQVIDRANRAAEQLNGARILWVDDDFYANATILQFLETYNIAIDDVDATGKALRVLQWSSAAYDVIISDMVRGDEYPAAYNLIDGMQTLRQQGKLAVDYLPPVIIFVGSLNDTPIQYPAVTLGITNDPVKLIHMIIDAVERRSRNRQASA